MIHLLLIFALAQDDLLTAAKSPYTLQKYVESHEAIDWKPLWKQLGSTGAFLPDYGEPYSHGCSTSLIDVNDPKQLIVVLRHGSSGFEVFLRYLPELGGQWRLADDYTPLRNYSLHHEVVRFGARPFLIVRSLGYSGSGLYTEYETWIDLTRPKLDPVFGFTPKGNLWRLGLGISREVVGTIASLEPMPENAVAVNRSVTFSFGTDDRKLWLGTKTSRTVYVRQSDGKFKFERTLSDVDQKEMEDLYENFDPDMTDENFLKYDIDQLKKFASGPEGPEKRWLRKFLAESDNTPEKRALQSLLRH